MSTVANDHPVQAFSCSDFILTPCMAFRSEDGLVGINGEPVMTIAKAAKFYDMEVSDLDRLWRAAFSFLGNNYESSHD